MRELKPITALGADSPAREVCGALILSENPELALASLMLRRGVERPAPMGLVLPEPGGWARADGVAAFWSAPGQWMIEAEGRADEDFARVLQAAAPGCSVTEQTDGWVAFEICSSEGEGPILELMEKLVNVDLSDFSPGHATRTMLEHMSVFLIRRTGNRLAVFGMRSAAGSLWHALVNAVGRQKGGKT